MTPGFSAGDDTYPLPERRHSMQELAERVKELGEAVRALRREQDEDRRLIEVMLMLWGIDPKNPESVAKAYSSRLKLIDGGRLLLIFTGGGAAAMILAAINWLPNLWRGMK